MFSKINKEIDKFTSTIKEVQGCDKLLDYMNTSIYSSIKLLIFASKTFSIFARVVMFFIIFIAGLIMLAIIGAMPFNISFLVIVELILFFLALIYVMYFKKLLISKIEETKIDMKLDTRDLFS